MSSTAKGPALRRSFLLGKASNNGCWLGQLPEGFLYNMCMQKWIVIQCLEVLTKKNRDEILFILFILGFMTLSIIFANEDIQKAL